MAAGIHNETRMARLLYSSGPASGRPGGVDEGPAGREGHLPPLLRYSRGRVPGAWRFPTRGRFASEGSSWDLGRVSDLRSEREGGEEYPLAGGDDGEDADAGGG